MEGLSSSPKSSDDEGNHPQMDVEGGEVDLDNTPHLSEEVGSSILEYHTIPSSAYSSLMPYQIPQVRHILKTCFPGEIHRIVDATAHIGGDSILFANTFPDAKIVSIDVDPCAIECLRYNVEHFSDPSRFTIVEENSVRYINDQLDSEADQKLPRTEADFYYFDPPWGGPKYFTKKEVSLFLDTVPIADVINMAFEAGLTRKVLLKAPRNFAYPTFKAAVRGVCKLFYIKKPQKNGSVAYALVLIEHLPKS
jgi:predicted RNA methylase